MSVVPPKRPDKVAWFEARIAQWVAEATSIGTTSAACTVMQAKITAARASLNAKILAEAASEAATETFYNACDAMGVEGQSIIKSVRSKVESTGDMDIYALAMIPAPATPTPGGTPGTPREFSVELDAGDLILKWKCTNPASGGVVYQVYRRTTPTGEFESLGIAGEKKFVDATVPTGASEVTYKVRGVRPTAAGMWATYNVMFGLGGSVTGSAVEATPKIAA